MGAAVPVSVTIITKDEERNLGRCLASVRFADDVVVLDSGSTDRTAEVAARHGARFAHRAWTGYTDQKNAAADAARHPWILSLDADEWLAEAAGAEIARVLAAPEHVAYALRRVSAFSGGFLPRTWSGDVPVRLYRKDRARFEGAHVHESVSVDPSGTIGRLETTLYHLTHRSVADQVARLNRYSDLAARRAQDQGRRFSVARMLAGPAAAFFKMYVAKGGATEGVRGLVAAVDHAHYVFLKSAKLWERTRMPDPEFVRRVPPTPEDPEPGAAQSG
ncbi:MAG TPA: glycosyltransferase family 2 protein [Candidatus Bathyarchaeia archaeon]|nr:glycosyltransferase family 2 protein [Candidatus Bathyarchaeia archaeon]